MLQNPFKNENKVLVLSSLLVWAVSFVVDAFYVYGLQPQLIVYFIVNLLLWLAALSLRPKTKTALLLTVCGLSLSVFLALQPNTILAPVILVLWISFLPYQVSKLISWLVYAGVNLLLIALTLWLKPEQQAIVTASSFCVFQLFALASSFMRIDLSEKREALEAANARLQQAQSLLAETSRNEERVRIAQDLHDNIGQRLTAMHLNVEYAQHKIPDDFAEFTHALKKDLSNTMDELRGVVRQLKDRSEKSLLQHLDDICARIPELEFSHRLNCHVKNPLLSEQLVLCFQEGINNAVKHAAATSVELMADIENNSVVFCLQDNGKMQSTPSNHKLPGGNGLEGMRQRMAVFGATIQLQLPTDGEPTRLIIKVPKTEIIEKFSDGIND